MKTFLLFSFDTAISCLFLFSVILGVLFFQLFYMRFQFLCCFLRMLCFHDRRYHSDSIHVSAFQHIHISIVQSTDSYRRNRYCLTYLVQCFHGGPDCYHLCCRRKDCSHAKVIRTLFICFLRSFHRLCRSSYDFIRCSILLPAETGIKDPTQTPAASQAMATSTRSSMISGI